MGTTVLLLPNFVFVTLNPNPNPNRNPQTLKYLSQIFQEFGSVSQTKENFENPMTPFNTTDSIYMNKFMYIRNARD
jgi:superoxide dismutase